MPNKNWKQEAIPPLNVFLIAANSFCTLLHHANTPHAVSRLVALCYVPLGIFAMFGGTTEFICEIKTDTASSDSNFSWFSWVPAYHDC